MTNLEKLYYNMHVLTDDYADSKEAEEARDAVEKDLGKDFMKYEDTIAAFASATEKQGFITGFKCAVSLMTSGKEILA